MQCLVGVVVGNLETVGAPGPWGESEVNSLKSGVGFFVCLFVCLFVFFLGGHARTLACSIVEH